MTTLLEASRMALVALENIGCWLTTIGQKGLRDYEADAMEALSQAIEQAEKQERTQSKREWVGLSDQEIWDLGADHALDLAWAREIEAKLKEKNSGA